MFTKLKDALTVLLARHPIEAVMRIAERDHLTDYYEELATPNAHMREPARRKFGLMSEMRGGR